MKGWFSLQRELFEKPIWTTSDPIQKTILITLMGMANHEPNEWEFKGEKFTVQRGQMITSLESIVQVCGKGVTIQNVRTALKRFEKYGFLTNESTNKNRLITLVNYDFYQGNKDEPNKQTNKHLTSNQQATNKQLTTNNNVNNVNNDNKKEKDSSSRKLKFSDDDMTIVEFFISEIRKNNEGFKEPNKNQWANDIRLMVESDKRDRSEICKVIRFAQTDDFWFKNVLSPKTLRKQYDKLKMKLGGRKNNDKSISGSEKDSVDERFNW